MSWIVEIGDEFEPEFDELPEDVQTEILALAKVLQQFGPQLGRPRVDTLKDSSPLEHEGTAVRRRGWRLAGSLRLPTRRKAILLVAGDKSGVSKKKFYRELIRKADARFDAYLARLKKKRK